MLPEGPFKTWEISQVPNEKIAIGLVIGPATSSTELPTGSEVDIQISSGPELRTIPDSTNRQTI